MTEVTYFSADQVDKHLTEFVQMLKLTVDNGASIGWVMTISEEEAQQYWDSVKAQVANNDKILLVALQNEAVVGAVQLGLEQRENGNHRAEVQKLMVHPDSRRQGIARQLMERLDTAATDANRSLLVLDVRAGDPAETLYQKMGYTHVGNIPMYARTNDTQIDATAFYYKLLS